MLVLTIRSDNPEAEVGLYVNGKLLAYETWPAHRLLAETIHQKIQAMLKSQGLDWSDIEGLVCFQGPGSFTGLRIGLSIGNSLSYGLSVPIVASQGKDWAKLGLQRLAAGQNDQLAMPEYGAPVHITKPKK